MNRCFAIFATVLAVLMLVSATATAATVAKIDLNQLVGHSDVIVVADVTDTEAQRESDGRVYTTVHLEVVDIVDGKIPVEFTLRHVGGRDGDIATHAPGIPGFSKHERVLLFLGESNGRYGLVGLSQGKFQIAVGPDGETEFAIPQVQGHHLIPPDRAPAPRPDADLPNPKEFDADNHAETFGQVHSYREFRHQIERILKVQREEDQ